MAEDEVGGYQKTRPAQSSMTVDSHATAVVHSASYNLKRDVTRGEKEKGTLTLDKGEDPKTPTLSISRQRSIVGAPKSSHPNANTWTRW